jgi:hypothetical protein
MTTGSDEDFQEIVHAFVHESMAKNDACDQQFKIGDWPRWDYDSDLATLTFSEEGVPRVVADVLVIGTTRADQWQWTWANSNSPSLTRDQGEPIRFFGETNGWSKLATPFVESDEYTGWEMTSVAVHVLNAKGSYRFPTDEGFVYVVYKDIRWVV